MPELPSAVTALASRLDEAGWVRDLWVAGSLATGDHVPGVSDLDLVAIVVGPVDGTRQGWLSATHLALDDGAARGAALGCVYVDEALLLDPSARHPTWTHGRMVERVLSGVTRAELVRHGFAVHGRDPRSLLPPMSEDDVREAVRAELGGYWSWAARRPHLWLGPGMADLGLTSMARARHGLEHGTLLTKGHALAQVRAPGWLVAQMRTRRRGEDVTSPRVPAAWIAWRDARLTLRDAGLSRSGRRA